MNKKIIIVLIIILLGSGVGWFFANKIEDKTNLLLEVSTISNESNNLSLITEVTYFCKENKTIEAAFYEGKQQPVKPGEPPIPNGIVKLLLSDGRYFDLPQTISASGVRYANSDESFIFWSKGNSALILEDNAEKDYVGCIVLTQDPGGLPNSYLDSDIGFTVRYPADYSVDTSYKYQGLGPNKEINGIKFIIPETITAGTNLSSYDTGVSIEAIPEVQDCNASLFLDGDIEMEDISDNDREYSFASRIEGAAGNFYEERVWVFPGTNSCFAVRYFIHYTNIENYPEGAVSEFDREILRDEFDKIRRSLVTL